MAKELGLSNRTLLENLHYLGDGQLWRDGKRVPCTNAKCKNYLNIIHGSHYARAGKGQVYRLNFNNLIALATSVLKRLKLCLNVKLSGHVDIKD